MCPYLICSFCYDFLYFVTAFPHYVHLFSYILYQTDQQKKNAKIPLVNPILKSVSCVPPPGWGRFNENPCTRGHRGRLFLSWSSWYLGARQTWKLGGSEKFFLAGLPDTRRTIFSNKKICFWKHRPPGIRKTSKKQQYRHFCSLNPGFHWIHPSVRSCFYGNLSVHPMILFSGCIFLTFLCCFVFFY